MATREVGSQQRRHAGDGAAASLETQDVDDLHLGGVLLLFLDSERHSLSYVCEDPLRLLEQRAHAEQSLQMVLLLLEFLVAREHFGELLALAEQTFPVNLQLLLIIDERGLYRLQFVLQSVKSHRQRNEGIIVCVHNAADRILAATQEFCDVRLQIFQTARRRVLRQKLFGIEIRNQEIALAKQIDLFFHCFRSGIHGFHDPIEGRFRTERN